MAKDSKTATLKRLNRIEGQVRGLARMVEADRYCIDIVTQISAVRAALVVERGLVGRKQAAAALNESLELRSLSIGKGGDIGEQ